MRFLYPLSRQFPFDQVSAEIVAELEKRNWDVPGICVTFEDYGGVTYRSVLAVKGCDFTIHFHRSQGPLPGGKKNNVAAVTEVSIPGKQLRVHDDESGPRFYLYVGDDWVRDRERFMSGSMMNSKRDLAPRLYVEYSGGCNCRRGSDRLTSDLTHTHRGKRAPLLVYRRDLDRAYRLEDDDVTELSTANVMEEVRQYMADVVLKGILYGGLP